MPSKDENITDKELTFAIEDTVDDADVNLSHVPITMLSEFVIDVTKFLRGSKYTDVKNVVVEIKNGSVTLVAKGSEESLATAFADYESLQHDHDLSHIDPTRRKIIAKWQHQAKINPNRKYRLEHPKSTKPFVISTESEFVPSKITWVPSEHYVYGRVFDMGGKKRANVHIELVDGGTVTVESNHSALSSDRTNRLYHPQLMRVVAKQNLYTGELTDHKLISFEKYDPSTDESFLDELIPIGRQAWRGMHASEWAESERG